MGSNAIDADFFDALQEGAVRAVKEHLTTVITRKLRALDVDVAVFPTEEFVDHVLSDSGEPFLWDHDDADDRHITLDMDDDEVEDLDSLVRRLSDEDTVVAIVESATAEAAEQLLQELGLQWPEQKAHEDADLYCFRKLLRLRWGKALDAFQLLIGCASGLLEELSSPEEVADEEPSLLLEALGGILARMLRTSRAVWALLDHGLADDAYARARTLYELNVVSNCIADQGEDAAGRYLAYECVDLKKRLDNELEYGASIEQELQDEINEDYEAVLQMYGPAFKERYGWASKLTGVRTPNFVHLERVARQSRERKKTGASPMYKEASLQVHDGRAGLLGLASGGPDYIAIGHSNAGLEIPLVHSAYSLAQTAVVFVHSKHLDGSPSSIVYMKALMLLFERIEEECDKAAQQLSEDTDEIGLPDEISSFGFRRDART